VEDDRRARLTAAGYDQLTGWGDGQPATALAAFKKVCPALLKKSPEAAVGPGGIGGPASGWQAACRAAPSVAADDHEAARAYFEKWFRPFRVAADGGTASGLFTGYYEPELRGARTRGGRYTIPLYGRPSDLVTVDLRLFDPGLAGRTVTGQVKKGRLVPYPTRHSIARAGASLPATPLVWVDSAIDAFFLHIQGSGRIRLPDQSVLRLGYAASNGRRYTAIGKLLADRGHIQRDRVSMQSIRAWLSANPSEAQEIMAENARYVFFRPLTGDGPVGAQGVALTAGRSLAVDRSILPLGAPLWVETTDPLDPTRPLHRLMIAQDTGSAIKGAVRGDIFFGHGRLAARRAGLMKQRGRYFILLPRTGTPST
jgi:membrane-bound lytic murein transglycosylase A